MAGAPLELLRPAYVQKLDPSFMQRQHVRGVQPAQGRDFTRDQPQDGGGDGPPGGPASEGEVHPGLLRGWATRPHSAPPPRAMGGEGRGRASLPEAPGRPELRGNAEEQQVLPLPERVRGGQPAGGGGSLLGVRPRADLEELRAAVQRRAQLEQVCRCD